MGHSIQEIGKYINSRLSFYDCLSIFSTAAICLVFAFFIHYKQNSAVVPVLYRESSESNPTVKGVNSTGLPFGSKNGKTYTFSWCQGASQIKLANKIYFKTTVEAERTGRTLSKLCQK